MRKSHGSFWVILDIAVVAALVYSAYLSWTAPLGLSQKDSARLQTVEERNLGMSAVSGAVGATITTASIILSVTGAIVGLGSKNLPPAAKHHFLIVAAFSGFSLVVGVFNMAALPQLAWKQNVALSSVPAVLLAMQVYPMIPAFVRLCLGIYQVVRN